MLDLLRTIFTPGNFEPHIVHFIPNNMGLVWFEISGNALIALSYTLIPLAMLYLVRKRGDIPFGWLLVLYMAFIIMCGITHIMHIMTFWYPAYYLQAIVNMLTGLISFGTFLALIYTLPVLLKLPTPTQLEKANAELSEEIEARKQAENQLKENEKVISVKNETLVQALQESDRQKDELLKMNKFMVDRELKMTEIKKEIEELKRRSG